MGQIYEHFLYEGCAVDQPACTVEVLRNGKVLTQYGFWYLRREKIEDACMLRASQLANTNCLDPALRAYEIQIIQDQNRYRFIYDRKHFCFKETCELNESDSKTSDAIPASTSIVTPP